MAEDKDKKSGFNLNKGEKRKFDLGKSDNKPKFDLNKSDNKPKFDLNKSDNKPKFDLNKGDHKPKFDFSKDNNEPKSRSQSQSKIDLGKKDQSKTTKPTQSTTYSTSGPQGPSSTEEEPSNGGSGKGKWIIAALVVIALVIAGAWYFNKNKGSNANEPTEQVTSDSTANSSDSTQTAQNPDDASAPATGVQSGSKQNDGIEASPSPSSTSSDNSAARGSQSTQPSKASEPSASQPAGSVNSDVSSADIPSSVTEAAKQVWDGKYGNDPQRRHLLGSRYAEIQREVNKMHRAGYVH